MPEVFNPFIAKLLVFYPSCPNLAVTFSIENRKAFKSCTF